MFGGAASQESQGEKYQREEHDSPQAVKEEYEGKEICEECIQGKMWRHVRLSITYLAGGLEGIATVAWFGQTRVSEIALRSIVYRFRCCDELRRNGAGIGLAFDFYFDCGFFLGSAAAFQKVG